jgi:hypothetical protein
MVMLMTVVCMISMYKSAHNCVKLCCQHRTEPHHIKMVLNYDINK